MRGQVFYTKQLHIFFDRQYKLCKVKKLGTAQKGIPYLTTHDARTIRYPNPDIKVNDSVVVDIASGRITSFVRFDSGKLKLVSLNP